MNKRAQGSALLAVLWVSAALAAIGFSLATTVRGETDRTATAVDGLRAYHLAVGSIYRATYEILWSAQNPARRLVPPYATHLDYSFPTGNAAVEVIPEAAKLDANTASPELLYRVGVALGLDPERAREISTAIVDWRGPGSLLDGYYLSLTPSFRARHASLEEIEELLLVRGVTPDIFYGTYVPAGDSGAASRLVARPGLMDCLTVYDSKAGVDANAASPAVLTAIGFPPDAVSAFIERRRSGPLNPGQLAAFMGSYGITTLVPVRPDGNSILTIRATARLRLADGKLSDLRHTAAAQVKYMPAGFDAPIHILRWYQTAWSN
ncbi:MAG: general secretion pathway protein GspK, partial [Acidobacteriia bacterium]|nr:general secretion pathway protein GspK [Terriglobia bacterium]